MRTWKNQLLLAFGVVAAILTGNGGVSAYDFSFAVIADPHIDGNADREAHFRTAVAAVINTKSSKNTELVFVVGDIGWGGSGGTEHLSTAKTILDDLNTAGIPYVPIIGDNEVQTGCEEAFNDVFTPQYEYLSNVADIEHWKKAPVPVTDPVHGSVYLQNFSFDYKHCHFTCADFVSRASGDESGVLHDFGDGTGTWPWFQSDITTAAASSNKSESINVMTHIGMFGTGYPDVDKYLFSPSEMTTIEGFIDDYKDYVDSNYAGHIHQNLELNVPLFSPSPYYTVQVTDETWYDARWPFEINDPGITVRWVEVDNSGETITYSTYTEAVPEPSTVVLLLIGIVCLAALAVRRKLKCR